LNDLIEIAAVCAASIAGGILAGNGAVYAFNRIPYSWLKYGSANISEMRRPGDQRVKSVPWKYVFTASFIVIGIYMGISDWQYAIAGFIACFIILLCAMADRMYGRIPDQLIIMLAITGFGFIPAGADVGKMLLGVVTGFVAVTAICVARRLVTHGRLAMQEAKFAAASGLISGPRGAGFAVIAAALMAGIFAAWQIMHRKKESRMPFGMFLCIGTAVYIVVIHKWI
jgi:prepilin signal peptidase PulO-like enzyme (type II secretory pathway)